MALLSLRRPFVSVLRQGRVSDVSQRGGLARALATKVPYKGNVKQEKREKSESDKFFLKMLQAQPLKRK